LGIAERICGAAPKEANIELGSNPLKPRRFVFRLGGFGAKGSHLINNNQIYGVAVFGNFIILISVIGSPGILKIWDGRNRPFKPPGLFEWPVLLYSQ
jgi:hypothetical protein